MIRYYAMLSCNHPLLHKLNLLVVLTLMITSCYQLLSNENLLFTSGLAVSIIVLVFFGKTSEYKRKYLNRLN